MDEEVTEQAGEEGRDSLILRFVGEDSDGTPIHELQAAHVAEVLEGLVGLNSDFAKAGAFGDGPPSDLLVRPAREGSFIIEVVRWVHENPEMATATIGAVGGPSLGSVIWWATKSARANVSDFEYLENGRVKVKWQDDTVDEIPTEVWDELSKRKSRRKKRLRQIMAPLSDDAVTALQVSDLTRHWMPARKRMGARRQSSHLSARIISSHDLRTRSRRRTVSSRPRRGCQRSTSIRLTGGA